MIPVRFTNGQKQVAQQKDVAEREKLEGEANDINYSQSLGLKYPKNSRICSWTEAPLVGPDTKCLCLNKGFYPSPAGALCSDRSTESSTLSLFLSLLFFFFLFCLLSFTFCSRYFRLALFALFQILSGLFVHARQRQTTLSISRRDYFPFIVDDILCRSISERITLDVGRDSGTLISYFMSLTEIL